nr:Gag-Pol polyprotein [Tanacetum cinerariifolium]
DPLALMANSNNPYASPAPHQDLSPFNQNYMGVGHFARDCTVRPRRRDAAYLQTQLLIAQKEEAGIQLQAEEYDLMAAAADLDEIEEVNVNCILVANLQQASSSGTQTDSTPAETSHPTTSSIPLPSIPTAPIPPVTQPDTTPIRQYTRRARIAHSSALLTVADEPASPVRDVSEGEACPTDSGFIADQDRATIAKSSTLPHDSAPRVTSPAADEGKDVAATQSGDDTPIKGRSINEGEAAAERISNNLEEVARVLTSMDAATVLAGGIDVPTGSGFIPAAGPPATIISTGSEVARELEEQQEKENMRLNEQIARDAEVEMIHAEEELQGMIDSLDKSNETIAKYIARDAEVEMIHAEEELQGMIDSLDKSNETI